jgi:hypothetical protein
MIHISYSRYNIDLVTGESLIKERATTRINDFVGSLDVAGEPLLVPQTTNFFSRATLDTTWRFHVALRRSLEKQKVFIYVSGV